MDGPFGIPVGPPKPQGQFVFGGSSNTLGGVPVSFGSDGSTVTAVVPIQDIGSLAVRSNPAVVAFAAGSNTGNTAGNTATKYGTWVLAASTNVTVSGSTGANGIHTAWLSAVNAGAGNAAIAAGSNTGNTAGNTASQTGTWVIAGTNNITISGSTGAGGVHTAWISGAAGGGGGFSAGVSTGGNTSGNTSVITGQLVLAGGSNITLSESTNAGSATVTISGMGPITLSHYQNLDVIGSAGAEVSHSLSNATMLLFPIRINDVFPGYMTPSTILLPMSNSAWTQSTSFTSSYSVGFYTLVNQTQISRIFSASGTFGATANANNSNSFGGIRVLTVHSSQFDVQPTFSNTSYWCALYARSSNFQGTMGWYGGRFAHSQYSGVLGAGSQNTSVGSLMRFPFLGFYSASFTSAMPASIHISNMAATGSGLGMAVPRLVFNNYAGLAYGV